MIKVIMLWPSPALCMFFDEFGNVVSIFVNGNMFVVGVFEELSNVIGIGGN